MFGLGDRAFHASVHAAGLMGKTDSDNGGCPAESPSNKSLQIDRAMLADGTTVLLDLAQANYLNSNGIVTALNPIIGYKSSTKVAKEAHATGRSVYDIVIEQGLMTDRKSVV